MASSPMEVEDPNIKRDITGNRLATQDGSNKRPKLDVGETADLSTDPEKITSLTLIDVDNQGNNHNLTTEVGSSTIAYVSRDQLAKMEEQRGELRFQVITNDNVPQNLIYLIAAKNIFSLQLPNMPREYICRLVLDRNHYTMVVVKGKNKVVGGITYRPYISQGFAEIAFCAITSSEQVRGYGTRLMNNLKAHVIKFGIDHFLTYADNYAIGYFRKQGFTKAITMETSRWKGFIKDYDGGTLMECVINPYIEYTDVSGMVRKQRQALVERLSQITDSHIARPGLDHWKKQKQNGMEPTALQPEEVPFLKEAGWKPRAEPNPEDAVDAEEAQRRCTQTVLRSILSAIKANTHSWPFREPVDPNIVEDYYLVVNNPMDLQTMDTKLKNGDYNDKDSLLSDIQLIIDNCRRYNSKGTQYYRAADRLEQYVNAKFKANK